MKTLNLKSFKNGIAESTREESAGYVAHALNADFITDPERILPSKTLSTVNSRADGSEYVCLFTKNGLAHAVFVESGGTSIYREDTGSQFIVNTGTDAIPIGRGVTNNGGNTYGWNDRGDIWKFNGTTIAASIHNAPDFDTSFIPTKPITIAGTSYFPYFTGDNKGSVLRYDEPTDTWTNNVINLPGIPLASCQFDNDIAISVYTGTETRILVWDGINTTFKLNIGFGPEKCYQLESKWGTIFGGIKKGSDQFAIRTYTPIDNRGQEEDAYNEFRTFNISDVGQDHFASATGSDRLYFSCELGIITIGSTNTQKKPFSLSIEYANPSVLTATFPDPFYFSYMSVLETIDANDNSKRVDVISFDPLVENISYWFDTANTNSTMQIDTVITSFGEIDALKQIYSVDVLGGTVDSIKYLNVDSDTEYDMRVYSESNFNSAKKHTDGSFPTRCMETQAIIETENPISAIKLQAKTINNQT